MWLLKVKKVTNLARSHKPISICLVKGPTPKLHVAILFKRAFYVGQIVNFRGASNKHTISF